MIDTDTLTDAEMVTFCHQYMHASICACRIKAWRSVCEIEYELDEIGYIECDQEYSGDSADLSSDRAYKPYRYASGYKHSEVYRGYCRDIERSNERACPHDEEHIEYACSQEIAYGYAGLLAQSGYHRCCNVGGRRAKAHYRQPYESFREARPGGYT